MGCHSLLGVLFALMYVFVSILYVVFYLYGLMELIRLWLIVAIVVLSFDLIHCIGLTDWV